MVQEKYSILLIDDESGYRENFSKLLKRALTTPGIELNTVGSARQGFEIIRQNKALGKKTLAFIDIILPDINGDQIIKNLDSDSIPDEGILISAHKSQQELDQIRNNQKWLTRSLLKPIENSQIVDIVDSFIPHKNLTSSAAASFNYNQFDESLANYLQQEATEIKTILKRTVENTLEMGRKLIKVKEILPYGQFKLWINKEIGLHHSTAIHFMRVWNTFGDCQKTISESGLSVTVLYMLAAPSTPDDFRDQIIELSQEKTITLELVKKLRKEYDRQQEIETNPQNLTIDVDSSSEKEILSPKPQIVGIIRQDTPSNKFYQLGKHELFSGLPNSSDFIRRCPQNIALNIAFANSDWEKNELFPVASRSKLLLSSQIEDADLDLVTLQEIIRKSIEIYTNGGEIILFSYLPYPELLLITDRLDCQCLIAEPNLARCKNIISLWNRASSALKS